MVMTPVVRSTRRSRRKRKAQSDSNETSKKHSPDPDRLVSLSEVPPSVEDPAGECLMHTTVVLRARMEKRTQKRLVALGKRYASPVAPSISLKKASEKNNSAVCLSATSTATPAKSPSPVLATATVLPIAYQTNESHNDTTITSHCDSPSSPFRKKEAATEQLSGSDSDDPNKSAPPHSMFQFYSCSQLLAMKTHVQQVRALTQYLMDGEKIAPNTVSSRVQQLRSAIRKELLTSLAVLTHDLNDLFSWLK